MWKMSPPSLRAWLLGQARVRSHEVPVQGGSQVSKTHETVNVWDRRAGTWKFWCLDCGKEGFWHRTEEEANEEAAIHGAKWVTPQ